MKQLRHLGYFNDEEDINVLNENNPNEVLNYIKKGYGNFYHSTDSELKTFSTINVRESSFTNDGKYFITFPFEEKHVRIYNNKDCFIDVYEVVGDDGDYDMGFCNDTCIHCDNEVELPRKLSVYRCPSCGRWIPNCSMCYLIDNGDCPKVCPLEYEAQRRNKLEGLED